MQEHVVEALTPESPVDVSTKADNSMDEVVATIRYLLSDASRGLSGSVIPVNGSWSC